MPDAIARSFRNFSTDRRGNLTVLMAFAFLAATVAVGAAVDFARLLDTRTALAAVADAAALQVGLSTTEGQDALEGLAEDVIERNYSEREHGDVIEIDLSVNQATVTVTAIIRFETSFMRLAGFNYINLPVSSEVTKSGSNIEVALVLDTTGSMAGNKLNALKSAATDFVDEVVWDEQDEFYSKVALVPYSMGVNLGDLADDARGSASAGTCTTPGCQRYRFRNGRNQNRTFDLSTCVSERTGSEAYTDAPPDEAPVGHNYASPNNPCLDAELVPLSTNKDTLKDAIDSLRATGSTAGQIGIAWGWYVLSQDFGLWEGESEPAAYDADNLVKIAVIMTDGAFNTGHCNGVIARNSGRGSGASDDKINCDATNGSAPAQAQALCDAMKAKGIVVYTVGFDIEDDEEAQAVMTNCATSADHAYLAATGAELRDVFRQIGQKLTSIRISR